MVLTLSYLQRHPHKRKTRPLLHKFASSLRCSVSFLWFTYGVWRSADRGVVRVSSIEKKMQKFLLKNLVVFPRHFAPVTISCYTVLHCLTLLFAADTQKKYAKVWRMHRGGSEKPAAESENEKGEHKSEGEGEKEVSCVWDTVWLDIACEGLCEGMYCTRV